jgi:hypothetical protein
LNRYIDPNTEGVHPLRLKMTEDEMASVLQGIHDDQDWMTLEEIEAAMDLVFDHIVAMKQTVPGEVIIQ